MILVQYFNFTISSIHLYLYSAVINSCSVPWLVYVVKWYAWKCVKERQKEVYMNG